MQSPQACSDVSEAVLQLEFRDIPGHHRTHTEHAVHAAVVKKARKETKKSRHHSAAWKHDGAGLRDGAPVSPSFAGLGHGGFQFVISRSGRIEQLRGLGGAGSVDISSAQYTGLSSDEAFVDSSGKLFACRSGEDLGQPGRPIPDNSTEHSRLSLSHSVQVASPLILGPWHCCADWRPRM